MVTRARAIPKPAADVPGVVVLGSEDGPARISCVGVPELLLWMLVGSILVVPMAVIAGEAVHELAAIPVFVGGLFVGLLLALRLCSYSLTWNSDGTAAVRRWMSGSRWTCDRVAISRNGVVPRVEFATRTDGVRHRRGANIVVARPATSTTFATFWVRRSRFGRLRD